MVYLNFIYLRLNDFHKKFRSPKPDAFMGFKSQSRTSTAKCTVCWSTPISKILRSEIFYSTRLKRCHAWRRRPIGHYDGSRIKMYESFFKILRLGRRFSFNEFYRLNLVKISSFIPIIFLNPFNVFWYLLPLLLHYFLTPIIIGKKHFSGFFWWTSCCIRRCWRNFLFWLVCGDLLDEETRLDARSDVQQRADFSRWRIALRFRLSDVFTSEEETNREGNSGKIDVSLQKCHFEWIFKLS